MSKRASTSRARSKAKRSSKNPRWPEERTNGAAAEPMTSVGDLARQVQDARPDAFRGTDDGWPISPARWAAIETAHERYEATRNTWISAKLDTVAKKKEHDKAATELSEAITAARTGAPLPLFDENGREADQSRMEAAARTGGDLDDEGDEAANEDGDFATV